MDLDVFTIRKVKNGFVEDKDGDFIALPQEEMDIILSDYDYFKKRVIDQSNKQRNMARRANGYLVTSVEENRDPVGTFRTVISTPWPLSMPLEDAKRCSLDDKFGNLIGFIADLTENEDRCAYYAETEFTFHNVTSAYSVRFKSGREFWEAVIFHYGSIPYGAGGKGFTNPLND